MNNNQSKAHWKEKYKEYLPVRKVKHLELLRKYNVSFDYLLGLGLEESIMGKCVVCGADTIYRDSKTKNHVCCNECKYNQNKKEND